MLGTIYAKSRICNEKDARSLFFTAYTTKVAIAFLNKLLWTIVNHNNNFNLSFNEEDPTWMSQKFHLSWTKQTQKVDFNAFHNLPETFSDEVLD